MKKYTCLLALLLDHPAPGRGRCGFPHRVSRLTRSNRFTVYEAVEKTAAAGAQAIEFLSGPRSSVPPTRTGMSANLTDAQIAALKAHLKSNGVAAVSFYSDIPKDEAAARKVFTFAQKLGARSLEHRIRRLH